MQSHFQSRQSIVALLLALSVVGLLPMAAASPPDPVWIAGLYDEGDQDEAVGRVGALAGIVELRLINASSTGVFVGHSSASSSAVPTTYLASPPGRSPPLALGA